MSAQMHLLVGVDGDPGGWTVLRQAADLARRLGAHLDVAHVNGFGDGTAVSDLGGAVPVLPTGIADPRVILAVPATGPAGQDQRARVENELAGYGVAWTFHSRDGDPWQVLAELAEQLDAYCVVVGSRGEGIGAFLHRLLRPSVSHTLIAHQHRPVLVVAGVDQ